MTRNYQADYAPPASDKLDASLGSELGEKRPLSTVISSSSGKRRTIRNLTIGVDLLLVNLAFWLAYTVRYQFQWILEPTSFAPYADYFGQQFLFNLLVLITFAQNKVWRRRRGEFWVDEMGRVLTAAATTIALLMAYTFFFRPLAVSRLMLIWAFIFTVVLVSTARLLRRLLLSVLYQNGRYVDHVLVIGSGEAGRGLIRTLMARPDLGFKAIGYLDDGHDENNMGLGRIPHLGTLNDISQILPTISPKLHTVFIALPAEMQSQILPLLRLCEQAGVRAQVVPDLLHLSLHYVEFNNMAGIPMLSVRDVKMSQVGYLFKRVMDIGAVLIGLPFALFAMLIIAIAIKLDSKGPVFYAAPRVGRNGKQFNMFKFRSMVVGADQQKAKLQEQNEAAGGTIFKMKEDPRLTRVGRWIRRRSLDELPQIFNILLGHMSLVGPRPPLPEEVATYKPWQQRRLSVIGGLTGLWQVSGRSDLTFDELCLLDIYYIENWSLSLDVRILLQTIPHALFGRGAY